MVLLELKNIRKYFPVQKGPLREVVGWVRAVDGVDLTVEQSKNLGIVGESGCGKTTLAKIIMRLLQPDAGSILFDDHVISVLSTRQMRPLRKDMQMVFQDPYTSLDPRFTVGDSIGEAFRAFEGRMPARADKRVTQLLDTVGLLPEYLTRYPHELSGGERQRVAIARALAGKPKFLILDEAVSSLDVLTQSLILKLLAHLQEHFHLTYLVISHSLRVIKRTTYRVAVMYLGRVVELADTRDIFLRPLHPYTQALLAASVDFKTVLEGEPPSGALIPRGCRFHPRCPYRQQICSQIEPAFEQKRQGQSAACHFPLSKEGPLAA